MVIDGKKSVPPYTIEPSKGWFAIEVEPPSGGIGGLYWTKCRETFANNWKKVQDVYYCHEQGYAQAISVFINKIEAVLEETETQFSLTNRPSVLWMRPSDFWQTCPVRRSLFTVLLRCGSQYKIDVDNFEEALYSITYSKETKNAMMRFLYGFTTFDNAAAAAILHYAPAPNAGWWTLFHVATVEQVRLMLKNSKPILPLIGRGQLWN